MAPWVKVFGAKPEDFSSILGTHIVEGTDSFALPFDLYMYTAAQRRPHPQACVHPDTEIKINTCKQKKPLRIQSGN